MEKKISSTISQYNEAFQQELARLNKAQQAAVEHIEGPVLVVAGPGTGKTHILAARIGKILLDTDTNPNNILCLTFTDAGVTAMRERLVQLIGPEGHRVHIYTFHSFCNTIIQDNLELFGRHGLEPLTELERVEIIRKIIDKLDVQHPLKLGKADMYFYETHLFDLFQRMKTENWEVDYVLNQVDAYLEELPTRKEFIYQVNRKGIRKGDPKTALIEAAQERMKRLRAAVELYPNFLEEMRQARRYDYHDMILWVIQAFEQHEYLLRTYQEQYLYFLIDEYQDTNGAQNTIAQKLIAYWENPNIFIVGDDDQSIYEFQGARLKNLLDFYTLYRDTLELVVLKDNYRSTQNILNASYALVQHNERRIIYQLKDLGIDKKLRAQHPDRIGLNVQPQIIAYPNPLHELGGIVTQIEEWQAQEVPLDEVAIIYARHKQAEALIQVLEKKGVPYETKKKVNILDLPLIRNLLDLLRYIVLEYQRPHSGEHLLFKILHASFIGVSAQDLATLSGYLGRLDFNNKPYWRELLVSESRLEKYGLNSSIQLLQFGKLTEEILENINQKSVPNLIELLINRSGLLAYTINQPDKIWGLQVLKTFVNFVQKESDRNPRLELSDLLELIRRMESNRIGLEIQQEIRATNGVHLVTAHSAKGLEFERVFILDAVKDEWEPKSRGSAYRFPLPDTLTFSGEEDALEARRRLFYVALTRAKEHVQISYSERDSKGKDRQRALFVDEILESPGVTSEHRQLESEVLADLQYVQLFEKQAPQIPVQEKAFIDNLLKDFRLSISAMNRYLQCPLAFYYEHILRVPSIGSEAANYGTALHNSLQRLFEQMLLSKEKRFPNVPNLLGIFEHEMQKARGSFSAKEFKRRMELGRRNLTAYYHQKIKDWHRKVRVEYTIRNVELDGVPLTGTIDKLEFIDDQNVHIVDYKTGSLDDRKLQTAKNVEHKGGTYWRQLVFYKLMYEAFDRAGRLATKGTISYLDPDKDGLFQDKSVEYTPEGVSIVRTLIKNTYENIQAHNFYEGCGESNCTWCNFAKQTILADSLSVPEIEELDD